MEKDLIDKKLDAKSNLMEERIQFREPQVTSGHVYTCSMVSSMTMRQMLSSTIPIGPNQQEVTDQFVGDGDDSYTAPSKQTTGAVHQQVHKKTVAPITPNTSGDTHHGWS